MPGEERPVGLVFGVKPDRQPSPISPTSGASAPMDVRPPSQRKGRRSSPSPRRPEPRAWRQEASESAHPTSQTSATLRSHAETVQAAPPNPRSSATQPIASRASLTKPSNLPREIAVVGRRYAPSPTTDCKARTRSDRSRPRQWPRGRLKSGAKSCERPGAKCDQLRIIREMQDLTRQRCPLS